MSVLGVIPARFASTRFPGKVLVPIDGIPMVARVYYQVIQCREVNSVIVATESDQVKEAMEELNIPVELTRSDHNTGTERSAEIALHREDEIVVNIQADEPFIAPGIIDDTVSILLDIKGVHMSTAATTCLTQEEWINPHVVKVVVDENGFAQNFFRIKQGKLSNKYYKHIGVYAFRKDFLLKLVKRDKSPREIELRLEQMRALDAGDKITVSVTQDDVVSINTPNDINILKEERRIAQE